MARLLSLWEAAQQQGLVGPSPVTDHLVHAQRFAATIGASPRSAVDLGSGAGVPGLALALHWPTSHWRLLDANQRRGSFLAAAVEALDLGDRVVVDLRRAETVGRDPAQRFAHDLVVARSFGPPAVVAECGAPLLEVGGHLVVSEPPEDRDRWPTDGLATLGLVVVSPTLDAGFVRFRAATTCPDRFPRRVGVPTKRPLF
jgi:16S rRNA (guanine527-N7)-methyltransferase